MSEKLIPYLGSVLTQYENGCQLDLRVKLAIDILKAQPAMFMRRDGEAPRAGNAIDLATEFLAAAEARGLVHPLPTDNKIPAELRRHIERSVRANVYQQFSSQEIAQEEMPKVTAVGNGALAGLQGLPRA